MTVKEVPKWMWVVGVVLALALIGALAKPKADDSPSTPSRPSGNVELCQSLRDPDNLSLTASDFRRLSGFTQSQLLAYVNNRCPDQLSRVR